MIRTRFGRRTAIVGIALAAVAGLSACTNADATVQTSHDVPEAPPPAAPAPTTAPRTAHPSSGTPAPPSTAPPFVKLMPGMKGAAVADLQQKLTALGYWTGKVDGKYGDATQQAVFALQKAAGIKPSGNFSETTARALDAGIRPKARGKSGTLIEVDLKRDLVLFVANGQVNYILNASTGGGYTFEQDGHQNVAITPKGHFKTYRVIDGPDNGPLGLLWRPRFFTGGVAIHGDSYVPPRPASHGCVRISNEAIDWVWAMNLDPIGTTVWVY